MAFRHAILATTVLFSLASAQTWSLCNPMNVTTCPPNPALGTNATWDFSAETPDGNTWNTTLGPMTYGSSGAQFTITSEGDAPTIQSTFYIFFGEVTVEMKAATGQGIISSIVLESDDLDEVDWEFMGGNHTHVETNYFGKGNTTAFDRAVYYPMPDGSSPMDGWHNYTTRWSSAQIDWLIDGTLVRTLPYASANSGNNFPQTPMNIRLGIWAGGDSKLPQGTIDWAGGLTNFKQGPFQMLVKNVYVKDAQTGAKDYTWSDKSGSWQSIKTTMGQSPVAADLSTPHTLAGKWAALSQPARTAIIACSIGGASLLFISIIACCISQARKGKKEKALADAQYEKERAEFDSYRMQMMKGGFSSNSQPVYGGYAQNGAPVYYGKG